MEKKISLLVPSQFPSFYQQYGPAFIEFVRAYYAWMEEPGNPLYYSRRQLESFDIDETLDEFLEHFQKKYLYGIPFDVIINKRQLIKHVLDAYRSKGSVQCFKLLFRLIYNEDVEVYLPGNDLLRASDGTWVQPYYIEISPSLYNTSFNGQTIVGLSSGTEAIVESVIRLPLNEHENTIAFLTNIIPRGGNFNVGEIVIEKNLLGSNNFNQVIADSPAVLGSMSQPQIISGGANFAVGDQLSIVYNDLSTGVKLADGVGGKVRVTAIGEGIGQLNFSILNYGFGITSNANIFIYANTTDAPTLPASFNIRSIASAQTLTYNTDLLCDYANVTFEDASFGFPGDPAANATSNTIENMLSYSNNIFGSLSTLTNIQGGQGYTKEAKVFVQDFIFSGPLGNVSYNTGNLTVTGTGTSFTSYFSANAAIQLQANSSNNDTKEVHIIASVANNTSLTLYGKPSINSTASAKFAIAATILPANFTPDTDVMQSVDNTLNGANILIFAGPNAGNGVIQSVTAIDSGFGHIKDQVVKLYPSESLAVPTIVDAGINYSNGDIISSVGGNPVITAKGTVTTNNSGAITSIAWIAGSGYQNLPELSIITRNGSNAELSTSIVEFDTTTEVTAKIILKGIGRKRGFWSTTRSFLSSDKYLQDSYYWQEHSYVLRAAVTLNKYRDILYNTFHPAGSEMFGEFTATATATANSSVGYSGQPSIS